MIKTNREKWIDDFVGSTADKEYAYCYCLECDKRIRFPKLFCKKCMREK